jgi:hypothetical protein
VEGVVSFKLQKDFSREQRLKTRARASLAMAHAAAARRNERAEFPGYTGAPFLYEPRMRLDLPRGLWLAMQRELSRLEEE